MINYWQEGVIPSRDDLANKTLTESSIFYKFNSHGFRTSEIDVNGNNIICLGCSHTEGTGVQNPWPVLLEKYFPEFNVYNLGMKSSSVESVVRVLTNVSKIIKPKIVFVLWPHFGRFETYHDNEFESIKSHGPWNMKRWAMDHYDELTCYNRFYRNKLVANLLAFKYNFQLVDYKVSDLDNWGATETITIDRATDGEHYGPIVHQHLADVFYKQYQNYDHQQI